MALNREHLSYRWLIKGKQATVIQIALLVGPNQVDDTRPHQCGASSWEERFSWMVRFQPGGPPV